MKKTHDRANDRTSLYLLDEYVFVFIIKRIYIERSNRNAKDDVSSSPTCGYNGGRNFDEAISLANSLQDSRRMADI